MNSTYISILILIVSYVISNIMFSKPIASFQPYSLFMSAICASGYYYMTQKNNTIITTTQNNYEDILPPTSVFDSKS